MRLSEMRRAAAEAQLRMTEQQQRVAEVEADIAPPDRGTGAAEDEAKASDGSESSPGDTTTRDTISRKQYCNPFKGSTCKNRPRESKLHPRGSKSVPKGTQKAPSLV